jgi:hypothetical protein
VLSGRQPQGLRIQASQAPYETFLAQVELIKSSGAQMDNNKTWWHNTDTIRPQELDVKWGQSRGVIGQLPIFRRVHYQVELRRFELLTSCMPCKRSTN